jgi:hypothetical protein
LNGFFAVKEVVLTQNRQSLFTVPCGAPEENNLFSGFSLGATFRFGHLRLRISPSAAFTGTPGLEPTITEKQGIVTFTIL